MVAGSSEAPQSWQKVRGGSQQTHFQSPQSLQAGSGRLGKGQASGPSQ
jgi:hypothetical protein